MFETSLLDLVLIVTSLHVSSLSSSALAASEWLHHSDAAILMMKCWGCLVELSETENKSCSNVLDPLDRSNHQLRKASKVSVAVVQTAAYVGFLYFEIHRMMPFC